MTEFGTQDGMTKEQMAQHLANFYRSYLDWVESGAPRGEPYKRYNGLCDALCVWSYANGIKGRAYEQLDSEMQEQFCAAGLDSGYPFNNGYEDYEEEYDKHTNASRIAWVTERAAPKV